MIDEGVAFKAPIKWSYRRGSSTIGQIFYDLDDKSRVIDNAVF